MIRSILSGSFIQYARLFLNFSSTIVYTALNVNDEREARPLSRLRPPNSVHISAVFVGVVVVRGFCVDRCAGFLFTF